LAPDAELAQRYADRSREPGLLFRREHQLLMLGAAAQACRVQHYRLHAAAFDPTHVHLLVSWRCDRGWLRVRTGLRQTITLRLNARFGRRTWFSRSGSRRRVRDLGHFDYLVTTYLPDHRGICWSEQLTTDTPPSS
jgi:REP element-mobilizing transposase RayT